MTLNVSANVVSIESQAAMYIRTEGYAHTHSPTSTATKGYDCAFCDKSTKIGTLVVVYIYKLI